MKTQFQHKIQNQSELALAGQDLRFVPSEDFIWIIRCANTIYYR